MPASATRSTTPALLKAMLTAVHVTGAGALYRGVTQARGAVFMLHHVHPTATATFRPNRILTVTPDFLEQVIRHVRTRGFDIVTLDEMAERVLARSRSTKPFACFTFDDGYRDVVEHAYPVLKRHNVPFAVYVPSSFAEGQADLWWLTLEDVVLRARQLDADLPEGRQVFPLGSTASRARCFNRIYWRLRSIDERAARAMVHRWAREVGIDPFQRGRDLALTWRELRAFAQDPLVTIGAHSVSHHAMAQLDEADVRREIRTNVADIERELNVPCTHFSFPYGDRRSAGARDFELVRELGLTTAVTTRKGLVPLTGDSDLMAVPRFSLNGDYQQLSSIDALLTGLPFDFLHVADRVRSVGAAGADIASGAISAIVPTRNRRGGL